MDASGFKGRTGIPIPPSARGVMPQGMAAALAATPAQELPVVPVPTTAPPGLTWDTIERVPLDQFTDDLARDIYGIEVVASRYGLTVKQAETLAAQPEVARLLALKKGIWESDGNIPERFRTYCQVGLLESAPRILAMLQDDNVLPAVRVDLVKTLTKVAGMEAPPLPRALPEGFAGPLGPTFSVNINFAGGTERISTTVIQGEPFVGGNEGTGAGGDVDSGEGG